MESRVEERVAQVRLAGPTCRYDVEEVSRGVGTKYDDVDRRLIACVEGRILAWEASEGEGYRSNQEEEGRWKKGTKEERRNERRKRRTPDVTYVGGDVSRGARFSPDRCLLALQRTGIEIELCRKNGHSVDSWHKIKTLHDIVGFFWTRCSMANFVVVTRRGVELYYVESKENKVQLRGTKGHKVTWCIYSHAPRLLLLAKEKGEGRMYGYQFTSQECIKLPKFYVQESSSEPRKEDFNVLVLYGRIYCCHFDRSACKLSLYHLFRDAVVKEMDVPVYSAHVRVSAVDNTLIVHALQARVPIVLDVYQGELQMVSTPLPIGVFLRGRRRNDFVMEVYGEGWQFLAPDLVLDRRAGLLWRLILDLQGLVESTSEPAQLAAFLQRRDEARYPPPGPRALTLSLVETILVERADLPVLSSVFRVLATACAAAPCADSRMSDTGKTNSPAVSPAIFPRVLVEQVFEKLEQEGCVDGRYLLSALTEYMWSMESHAPGRCDAVLYAKIVSLSLRLGAHDRLQQLFRPGAMPPSHVLAPLADLLSALSEGGGWDEESSALLDNLLMDVSMLGGDKEQCVRLLLRQGRLMDALRHVRRWKVDVIPPQVFLDMAWSTGDPATYIAVYRFCCDAMPGGAPLLGTNAKERLQAMIRSCMPPVHEEGSTSLEWKG